MAKKWTIGLLVVAVLLLGTVAVALADDAGPADPPAHLWVAGLADLLGLSVEEMIAEMKDGQTVAELAQAQGIAREDVAELLMAPTVARVQQAVEDGNVDAEKAEERLAWLEEQMPKWLESGRLDQMVRQYFKARNRLQNWQTQQITIIAEALGLPVEDVKSALEAGLSVAELAETQGVELGEVAEALLAQHWEREKARLVDRLESGSGEALVHQPKPLDFLRLAREMLERRANQPRPAPRFGIPSLGW